MSNANQQSVTNPRGWVNVNSGRWHYLKSCAGEKYSKVGMDLQHAIAGEYDLCGVCATRYEWLDKE